MCEVAGELLSGDWHTFGLRIQKNLVSLRASLDAPIWYIGEYVVKGSSSGNMVGTGWSARKTQ